MRRYLQFLPTVLVAALILYLSLLREPHIHLDLSVDFLDKWEHALAYFTLTVVFFFDNHRYMRKQTSSNDFKQSQTTSNNFKQLQTIIVPVVFVLYGGLIELLQQYYFPPRTGEWLDWAADAVGVLVGSGVYKGLKWFEIV